MLGKSKFSRCHQCLCKCLLSSSRSVMSRVSEGKMASNILKSFPNLGMRRGRQEGAWGEAHMTWSNIAKQNNPIFAGLNSKLTQISFLLLSYLHCKWRTSKNIIFLSQFVFFKVLKPVIYHDSLMSEIISFHVILIRHYSNMTKAFLRCLKNKQANKHPIRQCYGMGYATLPIRFRVTSANLSPEWMKEASSSACTLATLRWPDGGERGMGERGGRERDGERAEGEDGEVSVEGGKSW